MKDNKFKNQYSFFEKSLLSVSASGVYLSIKDIIDIGKELEIELAYKKRSLVLQKLLVRVNQESKNNILINKLCSILNQKEEEYKSLLNLYPNTQHIISNWIRQVKNTKMLIQKELYRGYIYDQ